MNIKDIFILGILAVTGMLSVSCEQDFYRDQEPMLEFGSDVYVDSYITADKDVEGANVVLNYRNGCGRTVEIDMDNLVGIYADKITVTLNEDEGTIELPLKGTCPIEGLQDLKVRIHYDRFYIFCPFQIGVRPDIIDDIKILADPELTGVFLKDIDTEAYVTVAYMNGWGRSLTAKFECEDAGFSSEEQSFRLGLDGAAGTVKIPIVGKPQNTGEVKSKMILEMEDTDTPYTHEFTFDINDPVPYEPQEVKQILIVTDRNDLVADASRLETREFTYNTVFVDMNGDGYVSDNYEIWLDRNVGATSADVTSEDSYGFIYQASRNAPGYIRNSQNGGYWEGEMESVNNIFWYNGSGNPANELGISVLTKTVGPKNPCPDGFRMPTQDEFNRLIAYLGNSVDSYTGAPLYLPLPGEFNGNTAAEKTNVGVWGVYWGAPVANGGIMSLELKSNVKSVKLFNRTKGSGCSIRCVQAKPEEIKDYSYSANPTEIITPAE